MTIKILKAAKGTCKLGFSCSCAGKLFKQLRNHAKWPVLIKDSFQFVWKQASIKNDELPPMNTLLPEELQTDWVPIGAQFEEKGLL